ncbi:unnamed protein product [Sphagnum jensenii]|uniref:Uncharacterized protein n=1 Tax=Sphagnum jensenii TaxID=128206 RepID=A0ABP0WQJ9_9BRYO
MKKTVIKIGGGCLFNDVISRRPPGNKLSLAFYWLDHATSLVAGASTKSFRKDTRRAGLQHPEYMPAEWHEFVIHFFLLQAPTSGEGDVVFIVK